MNAFIKMRNYFLPVILVWIMVVTSACSDSLAPKTSNPETPIEHNMREFYNRLGGKTWLGDLLSPVLSGDDYYYQFTEKVILVYRPQEPVPKQFSLHPVGSEMHFQEPPEPLPADPKAVYVNGFVVWPEAVDLYNRWGRMCDPISALHFNDEQKRYEQYFQCFGVYRSEEEPVGSIHLLDYGAWKCGEACTTYSPDSKGFIPKSIFPDPPSKQDLATAEDKITIAADRIGRAITGFPLTPTYLSDDGTQYLKIYENVVFAIDRGDSERAYVLAITSSLHIEKAKPEKKIDEPGVYFFPKNGDLGYSVRPEFYNFLTLHGGLDTSGAPITNEYSLDNMVSRQCFENLCLDFHPKAGGSLKVRPASMGRIYKQLYYRMELTTPITITDASYVSIYPWEASPLIPSDQPQEIGAAVYDNYVSIPNVQVILSVRMPDDKWKDFEPKPTDQNGQVNFKLDPIEAPNGTIILYQVCLYGIDEERNFCVMEDFTIWGNP